MARTVPTDVNLHSISKEDFYQLYKYHNIKKNDLKRYPEAHKAMVIQIVNHPKFIEQFEGPKPCSPCGGRTENSRSCQPAKCVTLMEGFECTQHCHGNKCENRRLARGDYVDVMRVVGSSVEPDEFGIIAQKPAEPGNVIGEYVGVLKIGNRLPAGNKFCIPIGENFSDGRQPVLYLDASKRGNVARFIQTSCHVNCKYVTLISGKAYRVAIIATKKINVGDELFVAKPAHLENRVKCICGKQSCPIGKGTRDAIGIYRPDLRFNNGKLIPDWEKYENLGPIRLKLTKKQHCPVATKRKVTFAIPLCAYKKYSRDSGSSSSDDDEN